VVLDKLPDECRLKNEATYPWLENLYPSIKSKKSFDSNINTNSRCGRSLAVAVCLPAPSMIPEDINA
jgi:hypothetical protein